MLMGIPAQKGSTMSVAPSQQAPITPQNGPVAPIGKPTVPALVAAIGAVFAAIFSYVLGMFLQAGMNWLKSLFRPSSGTVQVLFVVAGIAVVLLGAALFVTLKKLGHVLLAFASLWFVLYGAYLLGSGIFFRRLYLYMPFHSLTMMKFVLFDLPTILLLVGLLVAFIALIRLYKGLNTAGRVLAVIDMVIIGIIWIVLLVDVIMVTTNGVRTSPIGGQYSASFTSLLLLSAVLFALAFGKPRQPQPVMAYPGYVPGQYPAQPWQQTPTPVGVQPATQPAAPAQPMP